MQMDKEQTVINRVIAGKIDDFEFLVKKYEKKLFTVVGNMVNRSALTEDIVQDVFITAYRKLKSYNSKKGAFSTWLFCIARNRCINELKKKSEYPLPDYTEIKSNENLVKTIIKNELNKKLDRVINELPINERMIFILAELEDISYKQISDIMKIRIGTVKSRLFRIKEKLRNILKEYKNE